MNEQQRLYLAQARSDWAAYHRLEGVDICHRLHYLQMCTEKLGKAYFWRDTRQGDFGHAVFVRFLRSIGGHRKTARGLDYSGVRSFNSWILSVLGLAHAIETLAPALAGDGPNPEYPWPRDHPRFTPAHHQFQVWDDFNEPNGRLLKDLIDKVLLNFEAWY